MTQAITSSLTTIVNNSLSVLKKAQENAPTRATVIAAGTAAFNATKDFTYTALQGAHRLVTDPKSVAAQGATAYKTTRAWLEPAPIVPLPLKEKRADPLKDATVDELRTLTKRQRKTFVRSIGTFATLKTVYETVCGVGTSKNPEFYNCILDHTDTLTDKEHKALIMKRFYPWIDKAPVFFLTKLVARLSFHIILPFITDIVDSISSRVLRDVRASIDSDEKNKGENIGNRHIANINGYLKELCDAYEELKKSSAQGKIDTAIEAQLKTGLQKLAGEVGIPAENFKQADLNKLFIDVFLATYPLKFNLRDTVDVLLHQVKFPKDSIFRILNPLIWLVIYIISWITWFVLGYTEEMANRVLRRKVGQFLTETDLLGTLMDTVVKSASAPNFPHTLHTSLSEILNDLGHILEEPAPAEVNATVKLQGVDRLVNQVFTLLGVCKNQDIEDLKKPIAKAPLFMRVLDLETIVNQAIVKEVTNLLPSAYETLAQPKQLEKIILSGFTNLNNLYNIPNAPNAEEVKQAEEDVIKLKDDLISFIVRDVLKSLSSKQLALLKKETRWGKYIPDRLGRAADFLLNRQGPQTLLHDRVHAIVKGRTDAIFQSLLLKPYHYNQGLSRLVLLPFIRAKSKKTSYTQTT